MRYLFVALLTLSYGELFACPALAAPTTKVNPISSVVIFGDSYTDQGVSQYRPGSNGQVGTPVRALNSALTLQDRWILTNTGELGHSSVNWRACMARVCNSILKGKCLRLCTIWICMRQHLRFLLSARSETESDSNISRRQSICQQHRSKGTLQSKFSDCVRYLDRNKWSWKWCLSHREPAERNAHNQLHRLCLRATW